MARSAGEIIEGRDLMMYVNTAASNETPVYELQAAATSHTVTYGSETKERITKDNANGAYGEKKVTKLSVSIKCEALVSFGAEMGYLPDGDFPNHQGTGPFYRSLFGHAAYEKWLQAYGSGTVRVGCLRSGSEAGG